MGRLKFNSSRGEVGILQEEKNCVAVQHTTLQFQVTRL
jgi:hypothetical protein